MIKTSIVLGMDNNFPIFHKHDGLAKNYEIANWVFEYCGWKPVNDYPQLAICIGIIPWELGDLFFPSNNLEFWVLNERFHYN